MSIQDPHKRDNTLERVIISVKDNDGALVIGAEYTCDLTTTRSRLKKKEKLTRIPALKLASLKKRIERIAEEEGSDNETMVTKTTRKGK